MGEIIYLLIIVYMIPKKKWNGMLFQPKGLACVSVHEPSGDSVATLIIVKRQLVVMGQMANWYSCSDTTYCSDSGLITCPC